MSNYRIYTSNELLTMPVGTVFDHSALGTCMIVRRNGVKIMIFRTALLSSCCISNTIYPFNMPMKVKHE